MRDNGTSSLSCLARTGNESENEENEAGASLGIKKKMEKAPTLKTLTDAGYLGCE